MYPYSYTTHHWTLPHLLQTGPRKQESSHRTNSAADSQHLLTSPEDSHQSLTPAGSHTPAPRPGEQPPAPRSQASGRRSGASSEYPVSNEQLSRAGHRPPCGTSAAPPDPCGARPGCGRTGLRHVQHRTQAHSSVIFN